MVFHRSMQIYSLRLSHLTQSIGVTEPSSYFIDEIHFSLAAQTEEVSFISEAGNTWLASENGILS